MKKNYVLQRLLRRNHTKKLFLFMTALLVLVTSAFSFADNPIVSHVYTADPAARVFNGRVYVMVTHDQDDQSDYSQLVDYYLFSSDDMVNWQDHGIVFNARTDTSWASLAYAPDWIYRNGKYYLYFPDSASSIGVAVSDQPEGPYTDPLGHSLINKNMTNCNVEWCFDPCVFLDDDGQAYVYFGGGGPGNARVIQLNDDMISVKGTAVTINAPDFFEAAYMHKRNGIYYFSYSTTFDNGAATIDYMTSSNPMSGFQYRGTVLGNPWENNGNNNHQSIIEYNNQWYIFYHNRAVANKVGASIYQRSINVDRLYYNSDGTMQIVNASSVGVPQIKNVDPFVVNEAETFDNQSGIETEECSEGTLNLAYLDSGDWVKISNVDFASGATGFEARIAATNSTSIDIVLDDLSNQPVGTLQVPDTGGYQIWQTPSTTISQVTGIHDLYLLFNGSCNVNWYRFSGSTSTSSLEIELETLADQNDFSPFTVEEDPSASGGQYIAWANDGSNQMLDTASDSETGKVEIAFTLSEAADVQFQIIADMANGNDDSFYYKIDSGSWATQNNTLTNGWETISIDTFTDLSSGEHTLTILRREDGALLDKVILTASAGEISSSSSDSGVCHLNVTTSGSSANLSWSYSNFTATYQEVYRSTDPDSSNRERIATDVAGTSYTDSGLSSGTYYYWIKARDASGNIVNSNADDAVISGSNPDPDDYETISVPFTQEGDGAYYWKTTSLGTYVNSWGLDTLTINGTDYTNTYLVSEDAPAKIDGYYYIYYKGSASWSHLEIKE